MLDEFETTVLIGPKEYPATVRYELDPSDGHPVIHDVEIKLVGKVNVLDMLDEKQLASIEEEIDKALYRDAEETKTERRLLDFEWARDIFRRGG